MNTKTNNYADWTHVDFLLEIKRLNEEGYKMSAELEWYKRFHDYVTMIDLVKEDDYIGVCKFLCSEEDK